ncbi:diphthamide biosynthesis protein 3 [Nematocida sp. LUAm3]|nr:diphthamide biosynthesis protein 3 [Nematocida sp. LUAm3]KAI5175458.1 diphthamide biosynthesis protein 3 [Nematocida sp. LUAm2]KAI5178375.1 diphthamide biosynthesis protein 3 [Nematocida sp. LUAm1]
MSSEEDNYHEEIDIDEFVYNPETDTYTYPCPCGDYFAITQEEIDNGEEAATCPSCSLVVKVLY